MARVFLPGVAAGLLAASGQAPVNIGVLTFAGLVCGFWLFMHRAGSARLAARFGWAFGFGYFALSLHWIVEPFLVDAPRHGWMAPFALIFMSGGLALFWGAAFWASRQSGRQWLLPLAMTGAELVRAYIFTGFPWGMPSYAYVAGGGAQIAAWIGPHGLNLLLFAMAYVTACHLRRWLGWGSAMVAGVAALPLLPDAPVDAAAPIARLVQPNAPQHQKWDPAHMQRFWDRAITATGASGEPDIIIWPETSIPALHENAEPLYAAISAAAGGTPVVAGVQRRAEGGFYNSLVLLDETGQTAQIYDKYHLVPFGEYLPFDALLRRIGIFGIAAEAAAGYRPGPGAMLVTLPDIGPALPLICYEAVFPQDVNAAPSRPSLILHITNDAWFGQLAGPYQHLAQTRMRAIEQGLPVLRAANTGISAVIDPKGRVTAAIPLNQSGYVDAAIPAALPPTVYSKTKDWPVLFILLGGILMVFGLKRRQTAIDRT